MLLLAADGATDYRLPTTVLVWLYSPLVRVLIFLGLRETQISIRVEESSESGVSEGSKDQYHWSVQSSRYGHRLAGSSGGAVDPAHQRSHRALQDARKRQSLAARPAETGQPAPPHARLLATQ